MKDNTIIYLIVGKVAGIILGVIISLIIVLQGEETGKYE